MHGQILPYLEVQECGQLAGAVHENVFQLASVMHPREYGIMSAWLELASSPRACSIFTNLRNKWQNGAQRNRAWCIGVHVLEIIQNLYNQNPWPCILLGYCCHSGFFCLNSRSTAMEVLTVCMLQDVHTVCACIKIINTCGLVQESKPIYWHPTHSPHETIVYQGFHGSILSTERRLYWLPW